MSNDKFVDFTARFQYLAALEDHRPNVLTDLQVNAFPIYQRCWQGDPDKTVLQDLAQLSAAVSLGGGESKTLAEALEKWANAVGFVDLWFLDAGLQTMHGWVQGKSVDKWMYFPNELEIPKFQPNFGHWVPSHSRWPDFKTCTDKIYRSGMVAYRARVRRLWGEGKTKLQEHAAWTVLWQLGKSPEAIRNWHFKNTGRTVSVANIQLAVHGFARAASITLRRPKAGRRAKKI